jgi:hypothetical protein
MASFLALLHYCHTGYMRSFRCIAPTLLYFGSLAWLYMVAPNPVMSSYGFTSVLLYVVAAWLAYGYIDAEPDAQQIVTALHAQSFLKFAAAKLAYLVLFTSPFAFIAVFCPPLAGVFERAATAEELGLALAGHLLLSWLGIGTGIFFSERLFPVNSYRLLVLLMVIASSVGAEGIRNALPAFAAPALWLLPPVRLVMRVFIGEEGADPAAAMSAAAGYAALQFVLFLMFLKRKGL